MFGEDAQKQGVELRQRIGYLPGELALYSNMKAAEFFRMYAYLRGGNGDRNYWKELAERLDLVTNRRIRQFSRGNKQKVGVIAAFMSKADLLILDEPTSGLDPLVQRTVLEMVREVKAEGHTVFFSSHILSEVQAVCDRVGIIRDGLLVETQRVEDMIAQRMNRISLIFDRIPPEGTFNFEGVVELDRAEKTIVLEVRENLPSVLAAAAKHKVMDIETHNISLEEIFLAYYSDGKGGGHV